MTPLTVSATGSPSAAGRAVVLGRRLGPLGVTAGLEPGDYLVKDSAILLGEVVTIERRRDVTFVGLDLGWNVAASYFAYKYAQELVVCRAADAERTDVVTVAGHINEAGDLFAEGYPCRASPRATSGRSSTPVATCTR
jgi:diaminopimelate decarboxylase